MWSARRKSWDEFVVDMVVEVCIWRRDGEASDHRSQWIVVRKWFGIALRWDNVNFRMLIRTGAMIGGPTPPYRSPVHLGGVPHSLGLTFPGRPLCLVVLRTIAPKQNFQISCQRLYAHVEGAWRDAFSTERGVPMSE